MQSPPGSPGNRFGFLMLSTFLFGLTKASGDSTFSKISPNHVANYCARGYCADNRPILGYGESPKKDQGDGAPYKMSAV